LKKDKTGAVRTTVQKSFAQSTPPMEITIGNRTYVVNGFFKPTGKTISEKLYSIMEKEVEITGAARYNDFIPNESLAVGNLRRA
jgi:hypothetical protein